MPNIERGPNIFERKEKVLSGQREGISKKEMIEGLGKLLKKPEKFIDGLTEKFSQNKLPEVLETIKEIKEAMPEKPEQKIVNMAILLEKIKENPQGILLNDLSKESKFVKMTAFRYVKELKEKGLIKIGDYGKKTVFAAEKFPGALSELILKILKKEGKTSLKELTPELNELLGRPVYRSTVMRRIKELEEKGRVGVKERIKGTTTIFLPEKKGEILTISEIILKYIQKNPGDSLKGIGRELKFGHSVVYRGALKLIEEGKIVKFKVEGKSEIYPKKIYEDVKRIIGIEPDLKAIQIFISLSKYGLMPTRERLTWTKEDIDNYLKKFLKPDEISERLRRIAFEEDKTSLAILEKLKEIAPKDLKDKLNRIEKEVEKIKKTKPEEAQKILGAIEKVKAASENKEEN